MHGKIENGVFVRAPDVLTDEKGVQMFLPTDLAYERFGFKQVQETEKPEGDWVAQYVENGAEIVQEWIAGTPQETLEDEVNRLRELVLRLTDEILKE